MDSQTSNASASMQDAKNSIYNNASSAVNNVQSHPATQNVKETLTTGPVAETVKDQSAKTTSQLSDLKNSRVQPETPAATGQPLTHYHSFFYNMLSWKNPRATAISYVAIVAFIFAARYLPALRWTFKALYLTLGATAAAELIGKLVLSQGLASSFRPKRYYTIPREALEASLEDVEQLINFFVIESQRVLFAENVATTVLACSAAFISYWLIKILPFWGLSLISVSCMYLGPLIYMNNKELIDSNLAHAQNILSSQAAQVKDLAGQHTNRASAAAKQYTSEYTSKAQEMMGSARGRVPSAEVPKTTGPVSGPGSAPTLSTKDFPHAPKQEPVVGTTTHQEQYEKSTFGGQAVPAI